MLLKVTVTQLILIYHFICYASIIQIKSYFFGKLNDNFQLISENLFSPDKNSQFLCLQLPEYLYLYQTPYEEYQTFRLVYKLPNKIVLNGNSFVKKVRSAYIPINTSNLISLLEFNRFSDFYL